MYLIAIQEIVYFLHCFFYKRVKIPCRLYICVLPTHMCITYNAMKQK